MHKFDLFEWQEQMASYWDHYRLLQGVCSRQEQEVLPSTG